MSCIKIRNARANNLKGINLDIPLNAITVITGPSGSGKSTLAMDILFAEGQRRYMEALGLETGRWFKQYAPPLVDDIASIPPAVALSQKVYNRSPLSTILTFTGMARFARTMFGRYAGITCPECGIAITPLSVEEIVDEFLKMPHGTRFVVTAPVDSSLFKGMNTEELLKNLQSEGFTRIMVGGDIFYLEDLDHSTLTPDARPLLVVDRIINKDGILSRMADSVRLALKYGDGVVDMCVQKDRGAESLCHARTSRMICPECRRSFPELTPGLFREGNSAGRCRECLGKGCAKCRDTGLADFLLLAEVKGITFPDLLNMSVETLAKWCESVCSASVPASAENRAGGHIASAMLERLHYIERLGLGHLVIGRKTSSLSGGEFQKLRLASLLARDLSGAMFILDEPSASIPPGDFPYVWRQIEGLKKAGNTVIIVEHLPWFIKRADHVVETGPGAGRLGGRVLFSGIPAEIEKCSKSVTSPWLKRKFRQRRVQTEVSEYLKVKDIRHHGINIKRLVIPLKSLVCLTGGTAVGKTTVAGLICRTLSGKVEPVRTGELPSVSAMGCEMPDVVFIDNMPAASNASAMPVTYLGVFATIRQLFAKTPEARARGLKPAWFLLNRRGGRCEACQGRGLSSVDLDYMPSVVSTCQICGGARYNRDALSVKYRGMNMAELLEMTAVEGASFFSRIPAVRKPLELLEETGLGYLSLGQPLSTLSGGEAQRLKLARELPQDDRREKFYIMDTPLKGLHPSDVEKLVHLMRKLVVNGNSLLVIEQREQFLAAADHVVDLDKIVS